MVDLELGVPAVGTAAGTLFSACGLICAGALNTLGNNQKTYHEEANDGRQIMRDLRHYFPLSERPDRGTCRVGAPKMSKNIGLRACGLVDLERWPWVGEAECAPGSTGAATRPAAASPS